MRSRRRLPLCPTVVVLALSALPASAQSIRLQCPARTALHPLPGGRSADGSRVRCDNLTAGDGIVTMADGYPLYTFGFNRLPVTTDDPIDVMEQGTLAANFPGPTIALDEGDELYLNLTNVAMAMRPDLEDPHSVHFHGYPNAAPVFDGNPDNSISINQAATLTYYYVAPQPGTYMYHCHVEATEHMQMGMLANLYVRARQDRCGPSSPNGPCPAGHQAGDRYAYNDGDGSTRYQVDYPIQIGSFDPDFHDASFGVQPLPFAGMRDRYFMLNGRGYPDTVVAGALPVAVKEGTSANGTSQEVSSRIVARGGQKILLRISNLNVTQFNTLATIGIAMRVVGIDARLLRGDPEPGFPNGRNQSYLTNSITIGGGQSVDVILDTSTSDAGKTYFLYTTNLDHLANDAQNFGGMMTEIRVN